MREIVVSGNALEACARQLDQIGRDLNLAKQALNRVGWQSSGVANVRIAGGYAANRVRQQQKLLSAKADASADLSKSLKQVAGLYEQIERQLAGAPSSAPQSFGEDAMHQGSKAIEASRAFTENGQPGAASRTFDLPKFGWDALRKGIGSFGSGGKLIDAALGIGSGDGLEKNLVKAGDVFVKWGGMLKNYKKLKNLGQSYADNIYKKKLFGLDQYVKKPRPNATWTSTLGKSFKQGLKKEFTKKSSWVVSGITSAIDNYQEYKTGAITSDRAVVEWAAETATSVATTAALTAATGAVMMAAIGSAPVVAVAAVSGIAYLAVDTAFKHTIGKGKGIVESVGSAVGKAYDGFKGWLSKATKAKPARRRTLFAAWGR
jgi:hypothetical protein